MTRSSHPSRPPTRTPLLRASRSVGWVSIGWAVLSALAIAVVSILPSPGRSQTVPLESFAGRWAFAGGQADLQRMDDAINHVVDQLNLFIREIARGEIHRRITHEQHVVLGFRGDDRMTLALDNWGPVEVPVGGGSNQVRGPGGDQVRVSARFVDGRLVYRQATSQGMRQNVFSLAGDGSRLTMGVSISAGQLPADIRYRLTYRRR